MTTGLPTSTEPDLNVFLSPAAFWMPTLSVESAWTEHAPFAFWLIETLKPRRFVELGTHRGFSFFAVCQAVASLNLDTECFAVDHWKGDEHAGFYGDEIFGSVQELAIERYGGTAHLIRSAFDEAATAFADGSVDLLHVDGRHYYEDVKYDFECWRSKLSDQAVVLFHDTAVLDQGFGVHRFWSELRSEFPSFEFKHGHGLGVLGFGASLPPTIRTFFSTVSDPEATDLVRTVYSRLGLGVRSTLGHAAATSEASRERVRAEQAVAALDGVVSSVTWRATYPLRMIGRPMRALLRRWKPEPR